MQSFYRLLVGTAYAVAIFLFVGVTAMQFVSAYSTQVVSTVGTPQVVHTAPVTQDVSADEAQQTISVVPAPTATPVPSEPVASPTPAVKVVPTASAVVSSRAKTSSVPSSLVQPAASSPQSNSGTQASSGQIPVQSTPMPLTNIYASQHLFVQPLVTPASLKGSDLTAWQTLNSQPQALWLGEWSNPISTTVSTYIAAANAAQALPTLVLYDIPNRDCGGYSAGGLSSPAAYTQWVQSIATALHGTHTIVILEPDSISLTDCLSTADLQTRYSLLRSAVSTLTAAGGYVYLDAGHSNWISATDMANRLEQAGISQAAGFALNVSNFQTTQNEIAYGTSLSQLVGNAHFVVDTSRNGSGPDPTGAWCNPLNATLGNYPTLQTSNPLVDAFLWIKNPGESDGTCNGGPAAGTWWPQYAQQVLSAS